MGKSTVTVTITRARNILAMDKNGFSDPYCQCFLRGKEGKPIFSPLDRKQKKTKIIKKTLNPEWDETFEITTGIRKATGLVFQVWDWDKGMAKNDFLGRAEILFTDVNQSGQPTTKSLKLTSHKKKQQGIELGDLEVTVTLKKSLASGGPGDDDDEEDEEGASLDEVDEEGEFDEFLSTEAYTPDAFLNLPADKFQELTNANLHVSVCRFFSMFYTNGAPILAKYHEQRGDVEMNVGEWKTDPDLGHTRDIQFRAPVHAPMGPKSTILDEKQRYHLTKEKLIIEVTSNMRDIPYGDYFQVECRFVVTPKGPGSCNLSINCGVHFFKSTLFKGKIMSGTISESTESYKKFVKMCREFITERRATLGLGNDDEEEKKEEDAAAAAADDKKRESPLAPVIKMAGGVVPFSVISVLVLLVLYFYIRMRMLSSYADHLDGQVTEMRNLIDRLSNIPVVREIADAAAPQEVEL